MKLYCPLEAGVDNTSLRYRWLQMLKVIFNEALYCPLEAGVLCLGSIKLTFYARRSKRLKSCSVKDNSAVRNGPGALPSLVNVLSSVLGNPVRQWNPWWPVPSTEASPQMQGRTHDILFWHEASHLQTGCPGNSFFQMWAIRWQMVGCPSERRSTLSTPVARCAWANLKPLSTRVCKSPRFQLCSVLITDPRIRDYDTKLSRIMIQENPGLWYMLDLNHQVLDWHVIVTRRKPQTVIISKYSLCVAR